MAEAQGDRAADGDGQGGGQGGGSGLRRRIQKVYPGAICLSGSGSVRPRGFCERKASSELRVVLACTGISLWVKG